MKILCTSFSNASFDQRMQKVCTELASMDDVQCIWVSRKFKTNGSVINNQYHNNPISSVFSSGKLAYLFFNIQLFIQCMRYRPNCIYAVDLDTLLPAIIYKTLSGTKVIYDAHEYFTELPEVVHRYWTQWIWRMVARLSIPRVDARITVGPILAEVFEKRYKRKFDVIRNVPYTQTELPTAQKEKILIYQGAINVGRGLEALVESMVSTQGIHLIIAGTGDLELKIKQLVISLEIQDRVTFTGVLTPPKLKQLTETAWIGFNLLENSGLSYYYSLANKVFDYFQAGVPVITMDFPEYRRLFDEAPAGILIKQCTVEEIRSAIQTLSLDAILYSRAKEACTILAKKYCWENEKEVLYKIIRELR